MDIFLTVIIVFIIVLFAFIISKLNKRDENYTEQFSSDTYTDTPYREIADISSSYANKIVQVFEKEIKFDKTIIKIDLYALIIFYTRLLCTKGCREESVVRNITTNIITAFASKAAKEMRIDVGTFSDIISNRIPVFEKLYMKTDDPEKFTDRLLEEMGILLAHDVLHGGYEPFFLSSPLPILDIQVQFMLDLSVKAFFAKVIKESDSAISKIRKAYNLH